METILQNMCMIYDRDNDKILILDKVKKYGWEGLTFVGGHVEKGEVLYDLVKVRKIVWKEKFLKKPD